MGDEVITKVSPIIQSSMANIFHRFKVSRCQCEQMSELFDKYLAVNNQQNLAPWHKNVSKYGSKLCQNVNKPSKNCPIS